MNLTAAFWNLLRRRSDGTGIGTDHAIPFWDALRNTLCGRQARCVQIESPYAEWAAGAANAAGAVFFVSGGSTLRVWDHGLLLDDSNVTCRLRNITDGANVLAVVGPRAVVESDGETPLSTLAGGGAGKFVRFEFSNADGVNPHRGGAYIKATLE